MNNSQPDSSGAKITPDNPLFDIIEEAYRVFAYPKPSSTGVCEHCCMDGAIEKDFFNPPIRELPLHYVRDWYFAAYNPEGVPKATWAYLLPRLLEFLAAGEELNPCGIEVSLNRYQTGNPENWSPEEWGVLDRFQRVYLANKIEHGDEPLDDILCMLSLGGWQLQTILAQVSAVPDEILAQRFWNDWCEHHVPGREDIWITAFWESPGNSEAYQFYTSEDLYNRMETLALADDTNAELATKASAIATIIAAKFQS